MIVAVFSPFAIEGENVETPYGAAGPARQENIAGRTVIWLERRGDPRARVVAAKDLGATHAIGLGEAIVLASPQLPITNYQLPISRPSGVQSPPSLRSWVIPSDAIDQTRGAPTTIFTGSGLGYLPQTPPFCPETRAALVQNVARRYDGVVVAAPERPITPAEVRAWGILGGLIAMPGLAPEWYLCRELEIGYAPLCHVSWADGSSAPLTQAVARPLIDKIVPGLPETHSWEGSNAGARREMGEDWRRWIAGKGA